MYVAEDSKLLFVQLWGSLEMGSGDENAHGASNNVGPKIHCAASGSRPDTQTQLKICCWSKGVLFV